MYRKFCNVGKRKDETLKLVQGDRIRVRLPRGAFLELVERLAKTDNTPVQSFDGLRTNG